MIRIIRRDPSRAYLDRWLWIPKCYVDVNSVKSALTYEVASTFGAGKTRLLYLWKETQWHLLIPRAFWDPMRLPCPVVDCRPREYTEVDFKSHIKLDHRLKQVDGKKLLLPTGDDVQQKSIRALDDSPGGVLKLACGKGKTVVALEKIARGRVPALVMLDNTQLLYQWKQEAEALLSVPGGIGIYGDGKKEWQKGLVLATYHSIANWADTIPEEARRWFGQIFWDEGHHCPAPLFSRTADMFYGARYSLTATPERDDGLHVLSEGHIGPVLYTDLTPTMQPSLAFMWTGMSLDLRDASVASKVIDINGEVHTSKLYSYFGQWAPRVNILLKTIYEARQSGRMVLVLSNSVDEVVNLMSCWERPGQPLYTDIPVPTPAEVGEQLNPVELTNKDVTRIEKRLKTLRAQLQKASPTDAPVVQADINQLEQSLRQFDVHKKIQAELSKRQRKYISALVRESKDAGMLTYEVDPKTRQKFLAERNVIFAITKYGKEGMDCPRLDTVILSALFSNRNGLQQLMGRPTRPMPGKKTPVLLAMVDDIGQCIGMARKLMNHLRSWPSEEGGPYDPILIGFPTSWRTKTRTTTTELFGR